jgi:tRNA modification GTPase
LAASQRLLAGRLTDSISSIRSQILDTLSSIEAALDFTEQDIEFISTNEATEKLSDSISELDKLLIGSISYEEISELPAVGIAGATNAGKSSLLNRISGQSRSIVSEESKTTRDVLSSVVTLRHHKCVLFDCAGLIESPTNVLDELAQQAAIEALANSSTVIFCIDISKTDHKDDAAIFKMINPKNLIAVATKSDLLPQNELDKKLQELKDDFDIEFIATSSLKGNGIEILKEKIDRVLIDLAGGTETFTESDHDALALTARHRQSVTEAIENLTTAVDELKADQEEVAAMMLRAAWQGLAQIEQENIDEKILERIFQKFCIGK